MGTLTAKILLTSSDVTNDALVLESTVAHSTQNPVVGPSRMSTNAAAATNILTAAVHTDDTHVYLKNIDAIDSIEVADDAGNVICNLGPGHANLLTVKGGTGLEVTASANTPILEYGYWTAS